MIVFLDFEASSLSKHSYLIEVAWVFEDGHHRSHLIRPTPEWTDWSYEAEQIHGISRHLLLTEGHPVHDIANEMVSELSGHQLYASAPSWDGKWMSALLRAAGHPRHALRLKKTKDLFEEVVRQKVAGVLEKMSTVEIVDAVLEATEPASRAHRALPDAQLELSRFRRLRDGDYSSNANPDRAAISQS